MRRTLEYALYIASLVIFYARVAPALIWLVLTSRHPETSK